MQPRHCTSFVHTPAASHTLAMQTPDHFKIEFPNSFSSFPTFTFNNTHTHKHVFAKLFEKGQGLGLVHLFRLFLDVSCVSWIQFTWLGLSWVVPGGIVFACVELYWLVVLAWGALSCICWHFSVLSHRRASDVLVYAIWQSPWNGMFLVQVWRFKANIS